MISRSFYDIELNADGTLPSFLGISLDGLNDTVDSIPVALLKAPDIDLCV